MKGWAFIISIGTGKEIDIIVSEEVFGPLVRRLTDTLEIPSEAYVRINIGDNVLISKESKNDIYMSIIRNVAAKGYTEQDKCILYFS